MKPLWAPWRMEYILSSKTGECIFCSAHASKNIENLPTSWDKNKKILFRGKFSFVIMNIFPYNNGHLMVVPYRHTDSISKLPEEEFFELSKVLEKTVSVIKKAFNPEGMNIGMNVGKCAGAGVLDHLHWHVVPRWEGDTNFMPVFSESRVIPQHLDSAYEGLYPFFQE